MRMCRTRWVTLFPSSPTRRASNRGFLPLTLDEYLELLGWTGPQIRTEKRGAIPAALLPILERLRINGDAWVGLWSRPDHRSGQCGWRWRTAADLSTRGRRC